MKPKTRVFVCYGKDCRKAKGHRKLAEAVGDHERVKCQKICKGPVAGLDLDGTLEWFARLRGKKLRRALLSAITSGNVPDRLWKRRKKKRKNKLRD